MVEEETDNLERLFWKLIAYYVLEKEYVIAFTSNDETEVWLENNTDEEILRFHRKDFSWGNEISQDLDHFSLVLEEIKKSSRSKKLKCKTIYFSKEEPIPQTKTEEKKSQGIQHDYYVMTETNSLGDYSKLLNFLKEQSGEEIKRYLHLIIYDLTTFKAKIYAEHTRRVKEFNELFNHGKPFATYAFLLINVVMYFMLESFGGSTSIETLISFGAKFNPLIIDGQWWRLVTPMFLHIGVFHLLMNALALYYLGIFVEKMYGTPRFLIIYFFAGFLGTVASFYFNPQVSAGASGAIFGLFGALLYFGLVKREIFFKTIGKNLIFILGINLILGFTVEMIDNSAHVGGLIGGFLAAAVVQLPFQKSTRFKILAATLVTISTTVFLFLGYVKNIENPHPLTVLYQSQNYIEEKNYDQAYQLLMKQYDKGLEMEEFQFLLSYTEIQLGKYEDAINHLQKTIQLNPNFHEAHYNLALVYLELNEQKKALTSANKALTLKPDEQSYKNLVEELQESNKD